MTWIPTLIMSVFMLAGAGVGTWAWVAHQRGRKSLEWPHVQGTVTASLVRTSQSDSGGSYYPAVDYEYQVGGQKYESSRIGVGGAASVNSLAAEAVVSKYAPGTKVAVYYDPAKPGYAVLEPGANNRLVWSLAAGGLFAFSLGVAFKIFARF
jgi:hypothetical protein